MQYTYPEGLYVDVRIEHVFKTAISFTKTELEECKEQKYDAAFIRVYDGHRWYFSSTSDICAIQTKIDELAKLTTRKLSGQGIVDKFSTSVDEVIVYADKAVSDVDLQEKLTYLHALFPLVQDRQYVKLWYLDYIDEYTVKEFYNSKGAAVKSDFQRCGVSYAFRMAEGEQLLRNSVQYATTDFMQLQDVKVLQAKIEAALAECEQFLLNSQPVEPGDYTVIMAPEVTGVFTHECFGHKSESDFMIGDETAKAEWALGKKLGSDKLTIVDTGTLPGSGYVPYDDEGNPATTSYLIKNGILTGRLHDAESADALQEPVTGNARAVSYEFEPIVRMTTTYIEAGDQTLEELIASTKKGIFVKDITHGFGMSTFTLAPSLAYLIEDGQITKPVRVSVVSGNVFDAIGNIDGISDKMEFAQTVTGGCGKMEQAPLRVGFGGPYIRVKHMNVQ